MLLVLFVLLVNLSFHRPLLESFLFALALAVGLTPELLPMIVSVTLARGALRMAKEQGDRQAPRRHSRPRQHGPALHRQDRHADRGADSPDPADRDFRRGSRACARSCLAQQPFRNRSASPLDQAILEHGGGEGAGWTKLDEVPFDFERRRVSVLLEKDRRRILVVKGAPEDVLRLSSHYEEPGTADAAGP